MQAVIVARKRLGPVIAGILKLVQPSVGRLHDVKSCHFPEPVYPTVSASRDSTLLHLSQHVVCYELLSGPVAKHRKRVAPVPPMNLRQWRRRVYVPATKDQRDAAAPHSFWSVNLS
jgi:hypothetical protein